MFLKIIIIIISRNKVTPVGHTARQILLLLAAFPQTDITLYLASNTELINNLIQDLRVVMIECSTRDEEHFQECEDLLKKRFHYLSELIHLCTVSADSKDQKEKAMGFRDALLTAFHTFILQEYVKQELLAIQYEND